MSDARHMIKALFGVLLGGLCVFGYLTYGHLLTLRSLRDNRSLLLSKVEENYIASVLLYITAMTIDIGLTIPGATTLSFTGGLLFGQPYAALYAYIGYVLGACLSYFLVSNILTDFARWLIPRNSPRFKRIEGQLRKNAFMFMIAARFTLIMPYWFVNASAAILEVPLSTFGAATAICVIPGALIYTTAGKALGRVLDSMENIDSVSVSDILKLTLGGEDAQVVGVSIAVCALVALLVQRIQGKDQDDEGEAYKFRNE